MSLYDTLVAMGCTSWYQLHSSATNLITKTSADVSGTLSSVMINNRQLCGRFPNSPYIYNLNSISNDEFTILIWIKYTTSTTDYNYTIYESSDTTNTSYIKIEIDIDDKLNVILNNDTQTILTYPIPLLSTNWYNLVITCSSSVATLYINGISIVSNTYSTLNTAIQTKNTIGCNAVTNDNIFTGRLKNLFIFNSALTQSQIRKLYYLTYIE